MPSSALGEPLLATRDVNAPPASGNHLADALAKYIAAAAALHPPRRIRRGASVASALSKYGQIFTANPDKLPYEQRALLFGRSEVVEQIDAFVSHSWGSPGYMKYMTLLLEEAAPYAIVTNCLASLLAALVFSRARSVAFWACTAVSRSSAWAWSFLACADSCVRKSARASAVAWAASNIHGQGLSGNFACSVWVRARKLMQEAFP